MISRSRKDGMILQHNSHCVYVVYDLCDNECVVAFGSTLEELALFFGSNVNTIKKMVYQGFCLHGRYIAEKVYV